MLQKYDIIYKRVEFNGAKNAEYQESYRRYIS